MALLDRVIDTSNEGLFMWWAPWRNHRQRNIGWRLDCLLASESLFGRVASCGVLTEVGTSDHGPVMAAFSETDPGKDAAIDNEGWLRS